MSREGGNTDHRSQTHFHLDTEPQTLQGVLSVTAINPDMVIKCQCRKLRPIKNLYKLLSCVYETALDSITAR